MKPCDFHKTAAFLKNKKEEWHIRTSISRSYYGTFLYFREFFAHNGLTKKKNKKRDPHAFVNQCLQYCQVKEGIAAAVQLKDLCQYRSDADYKLAKSFTPNESNICLNNAQQTISDFDNAINADKNKRKEILKGATDYAQRKGWI